MTGPVDGDDAGTRCATDAASQPASDARWTSLPGVDLLILQPTPFCNIDCDYCYLPDRQKTSRMPMEVVGAAVDQIHRSGLVRHDYTVVWHAGEPLTVGVPYYEEAFAVVRDRHRGPHGYHHSFQTNGMLIDERWCALFREHDVRVGVSVDGPAFLHDRHRKTRSGKPTFEKTVAGIRALRDAGLDFHVITVLTRDSLPHAKALFDFYREHGVQRVCFNFEEHDGTNRGSSLAYDGVDADARRFLEEFLEFSVSTASGMSVREFDSLGAFLLHGPKDIGRRCQESDPFRILAVDTTGGFSTFSPELLGTPSERYGGFTLGNVLRDCLEDTLSSPRFAPIERDIAAGVDLCRASCAYFGVCGGGQASNKLAENGTFASAETLSCRLTKKAVVDAMLRVTERRLGIAPAVAAPDEMPRAS